MGESLDRTLRARDKENMRAYWAFYEPHYATINEELVTALRDDPVWKPIIEAMTPEIREAQNKRSLELQRAAIMHDQWDAYLADSRMQGAMYAKMGIPFSAWFDILALYRELLMPRMLSSVGGSVERLTTLLGGLHRWLDIAMATIGEGYVDAKQQIIAEQQDQLIRVQRDAISELSTPVIEVWDRVLVLPIIGTLDSHRTQQLTESLLIRVGAAEAEVVILDISGVPTVDTEISQNLLKTVNAARLMGASTILSGVRPETAQAMVHLGIDFGTVRSRRSLRQALALAMKMVADAAPGAEGGTIA